MSDRGPQFVGYFWKTVCKVLNIQQHLSTAYQPETDGSTERANQSLEEYLRFFTNYHQSDWAEWLPIAEFALNNRTSSATNTSPFFAEHGYHGSIGFQAIPEITGLPTPAQNGLAYTDKLQRMLPAMQQAMSSAQARYETQANWTRDATPKYQIGDSVWLDLRNYSTDCPSKKLDVKNAQFKVTQVVSPHAYWLDTPGNIHNVFHVSLLRPVANNPLPSQYMDDTKLPAIQGELGHEEWQIEEISDSKLDRRGHGQPRRKYLVKWQGYHT